MSLPLKKRNLVTPPTISRKDAALAHQFYKQTMSNARKKLLRAVNDASSKDRALAMQLDVGFAKFIHDIAVARRRKDHTTKVPTIARHPGAPTTPGAQILVTEFSSYREVLKSAKKDLKSALDAVGTSSDVRQEARKDLRGALVAPYSQADADEDHCSALYFLDANPANPHERKSSDASICPTNPDATNIAAVPKRTNLGDTATSPPGVVPQLNSFATTMATVPEEIQPRSTDVLCVESREYDAHQGNQLFAQLVAKESLSVHNASSTEADNLSDNVINVAYKIISRSGEKPGWEIS